MGAEELVRALADYIEAEADEKSAREEYEGYDWGYHGYSLISAKSLAAERFVSELSALIDARIAARAAANAPIATSVDPVRDVDQPCAVHTGGCDGKHEIHGPQFTVDKS